MVLFGWLLWVLLFGFCVLVYCLRSLVGFTFVLFVNLLTFCLFAVLGFCCWRADGFAGCFCGFVYMDCCLFVVFGFSLLVIVCLVFICLILLFNFVYLVWRCVLLGVVFACLLALFWCFRGWSFLLIVCDGLFPVVGFVWVDCLDNSVGIIWVLYGMVVI